MSLKVVAVYDNFYIANGAARELLNYGFHQEQIAIQSNSAGEEYGYYMDGTGIAGQVQSSTLPGSTGIGARAGSGIGWAAGFSVSLLVMTGALSIPGTASAPDFWSGIFGIALSAIICAFAGAIAGGLLGMVIGLGIPAQEAERYAETIRQGQVLVAVKTEPYTTGLVHDVLKRYRPQDIQEQPVR